MSGDDAIVLGCGGVGSAAAYFLARRGWRVLGLDRFPAAHDRGSSHGRTRIIRQAYFEHPHYVPLLLRAYRLWHELEAECGEKLYHETGLLQVGPPDGHVVRGVQASARDHHLEIERLDVDDVARRWPGLAAPPEMTGLFERRAGYLRVEACVAAHLRLAERHGAELLFGEQHAAKSWHVDGAHAVVETAAGTHRASKLILAAGSWAPRLLAELGVRFEVRRKPQFWYAAGQHYLASEGCPAYLFETPHGVFYGFPQIDGQGVKIAEHTGGEVVEDPLKVDRRLREVDQQRIERFASQHLPLLSDQLLAHSVCLYTMSPDEHFVVDVFPQHPQVVLAAGLSGHGFKFTGVLGEALAGLASEGKTPLPMEFLSLRRFSPNLPPR